MIAVHAGQWRKFSPANRDASVGRMNAKRVSSDDGVRSALWIGRGARGRGRDAPTEAHSGSLKRQRHSGQSAESPFSQRTWMCRTRHDRQKRCPHEVVAVQQSPTAASCDEPTASRHIAHSPLARFSTAVPGPRWAAMRPVVAKAARPSMAATAAASRPRSKTMGR